MTERYFLKNKNGEYLTALGRLTIHAAHAYSYDNEEADQIVKFNPDLKKVSALMKG